MPGICCDQNTSEFLLVLGFYRSYELSELSMYEYMPCVGCAHSVILLYVLLESTFYDD